MVDTVKCMKVSIKISKLHKQKSPVTMGRRTFFVNNIKTYKLRGYPWLKVYEVCSKGEGKHLCYTYEAAIPGQRCEKGVAKVKENTYAAPMKQLSPVKGVRKV